MLQIVYGEMTQRFWALAALAEDSGWFSVPTLWFTTIIASVPKDLMPFSDLYGHCACRWYSYIHTGKTLMYRKKKKFEKIIKGISVNEAPFWRSFHYVAQVSSEQKICAYLPCTGITSMYLT